MRPRERLGLRLDPFRSISKSPIQIPFTYPVLVEQIASSVGIL